MKKTMIWAVPLLAAVVAGVVCVVTLCSRPQEPAETAVDTEPAPEAPGEDKPKIEDGEDKPPEDGKVNPPGKKKKGKPRRIKIEDPYTPEERKLADGLQDALDGNNLEDVRREIEKIKRQDNAELKCEAMEALAFFGMSAIPDLVEFAKDSNQEVVDAAADKISFTLEELESEDCKLKAGTISTLLSMGGLWGEDAIETFVGQLEALGSDDELLAVQTLVDLIDGNGADERVKARAKEAYEFVTGEEYEGFEKAEAWFAEKARENADGEAEEAEPESEEPVLDAEEGEDDEEQ